MREERDTTQDVLDPMRVLFLCTHNSARSQMAEGLLRAKGGDAYHVFSAGTQPRSVHPLAVKVMRELGIDISENAGYQAKGIEMFENQPPMDLVVTACDDAAEKCPSFPHARQQIHWGFPDPGQATGTEQEQLAVFRHVRDLIAARISTFVHKQFISDTPLMSKGKQRAQGKSGLFTRKEKVER